MNGIFICNTKNKNIWFDDIGDSSSNEDYENNNYERKNSLNNLTDNYNQNGIDIDLIISNLIKRVYSLDYKNNYKNEQIHYNTFLFNYVKISIINIPSTGLIALGVFSQETKSSIIRIYLLNMIISYLNYIGDKKDFLNSKIFNENNSINKMNNMNYNNFLQSKIYDTFLSIPIQLHFNCISKKVFKRRLLYIKDIYYKNYYLIDLNSDKIILSLESLHDKNNGKEPELKTSDKKYIWKDLLYHCHNLKNDYIKKNNNIFNGIEYQNFFVKIEYKVTYPRRNFIIKFLPLLNGMCIIHEYIQFKLSTFEGEEKKVYNEKNIIYGYDAYDNIFRNSDNRYFENEHYILKQVHFFIIESLFCSNNLISKFFILNRKPKIYFSEEILKIIDKEITDYFKYNYNKFNYYEQSNYNSINEIINRILSVFYDDFMKINNNENILNKSLNQKSNIKNSLILKEIESLNKNKSLQITKNETLVFLFNSIQYNNNINPNDITLDLNDERISQLRITQKDIDELPNSRKSDIIDNKGRPISIRLSDFLTEKHPSKISQDSKIQNENKINENMNEYNQPLNEEEYNQTNNYKENEQELLYYQYPQYGYQNSEYNPNNIINTYSFPNRNLILIPSNGYNSEYLISNNNYIIDNNFNGFYSDDYNINNRYQYNSSEKKFTL